MTLYETIAAWERAARSAADDSREFGNIREYDYQSGSAAGHRRVLDLLERNGTGPKKEISDGRL